MYMERESKVKLEKNGKKKKALMLRVLVLIFMGNCLNRLTFAWFSINVGTINSEDLSKIIKKFHYNGCEKVKQCYKCLHI